MSAWAERLSLLFQRRKPPATSKGRPYSLIMLKVVRYSYKGLGTLLCRFNIWKTKHLWPWPCAFGHCWLCSCTYTSVATEADRLPAAGQRTALATTFTSSVWGQKNSQNVELRLYVLVVKSSYILALQYKAVVFDDWQDLARQDGSFVATNPLLDTTTYYILHG